MTKMMSPDLASSTWRVNNPREMFKEEYARGWVYGDESCLHRSQRERPLKGRVDKAGGPEVLIAGETALVMYLLAGKIFFRAPK